MLQTKSISYLLRKPFGRAKKLATEHAASLEESSGYDGQPNAGWRHHLPFYAHYPLDNQLTAADFHLPHRFWFAFKHLLSALKIPVAKSPWDDSSVMESLSQINQMRVESHRMIHKELIEKRHEQKRILVAPPWASATYDYLADIDAFASKAEALLTDPQSPLKNISLVKGTLKHWLEKAVTESAQKNRYASAPDSIRDLVDAIKADEPAFFRELIGGFSAFVSQAMHPLGGHAVIALNPNEKPQKLFDELRYSFTMIDEVGATHEYIPGESAYGDPDIRGNISVEAQAFEKGVPQSLISLARAVGCDESVILQLDNLSDTTSIFNGSIKSAITDEQVEALLEQGENCDVALLTGAQKVTTPYFSGVYERILSQIACSVILDLTPPPKDTVVPHEVSAQLYNAIRNSNAIAMITLNTSESLQILNRLSEACLVDSALRDLIDVPLLAELYDLAGVQGEVVQEGEDPRYITKAADFFARIFNSPVRVRGRGVDVIGHPGELTFEERATFLKMINGTRQLGALKAYASEGFMHEPSEMEYFGTEVHPRNFACTYASSVSINGPRPGTCYAETFSHVTRKDGRAVTLLVGYPEEFPDRSPSKISVGDYMAICMALLYTRESSLKDRDDGLRRDAAKAA